MNPFAEHAKNMVAYEEMTSEKIDGTEGNSVIYANTNFPAVVSAFQVMRELTGGGFVNKLVGQAIIQKSALPENISFESGKFITVRQIGGAVRQCQIEMVEDQFTEWRIHVLDMNQ